MDGAMDIQKRSYRPRAEFKLVDRKLWTESWEFQASVISFIQVKVETLNWWMAFLGGNHS
jgi:hypothetical protein